VLSENCDILPSSESSVTARRGLKSLASGPEKREQDATSGFMRALTPDKLPDPWLINSEYLLKELARIRELALRVPLTLGSYQPTNTVVDALWRLEDDLRYLLRLHREGQWAFAKRAQDVQAKAASGNVPRGRRTKKKAL
jgi:hypothetical protein